MKTARKTPRQTDRRSSRTETASRGERQGPYRTQEDLIQAVNHLALVSKLPDCCGKRVLDLGCGDGRYCRYAIEHGAIACTGIDPSEERLRQAYRENGSFWTDYQCMAIDAFEPDAASYDIVISSLALHRVADLDTLFSRVARGLIPGGRFVFSLPHPFLGACRAAKDCEASPDADQTAPGYFDEGPSRAGKRTMPDTDYHRTIATLINGLASAGLTVTNLAEPEPAACLPEPLPVENPALFRPLVLIVSTVRLF